MKNGRQSRETGNIGFTRHMMKINVREYRRGNEKWTIQRNWQHRVHKMTESKQNHNAICVGHHYYASIIIRFLYILLQATFANPHLVDSIITQGLDNTQQWVTKYKIEYSEDCVHYQQLQNPKVGVKVRG